MAVNWEITRTLRALGVDPGEGVWVSRDLGSDTKTAHTFGTEIEALRHAVLETNDHRGRKVFDTIFVPFGEDVLTYREPE